jgi:anti-sigma factor RsiW
MSDTLSWWRRMRGNREMASCLQTRRLLQGYLDGGADEVTARRITRHLDACRRCGLEVRTYKDIKATLARRGTAAVPEQSLSRLVTFADRLAGTDPTG